MFPNHKQVGGTVSRRLWLVPVLALGMVVALTALFTLSSARAQTVAGDFCFEGIVIDHEEEPLAGWQVSLTTPAGQVFTTTSAEDPDDKDEDLQEGEFEFEEDLITGVPGVYTLSIESRVGWEGVTPTEFNVKLEAGMDDCAQVRFKMRRIILVEVLKIDADHNLLEDWRIHASPGPGNIFAVPERETTNISGTALFSLTPGIWIFEEKPPKKSDVVDDDNGIDPFSPVVPPNGRVELDLKEGTPVESEPIRVIFKNEFKNNGCIRVTKTALNPNAVNGLIPQASDSEVTVLQQVNGNGPTFNENYAVGGWGFELLLADGTVFRKGVTGADGVLEFKRLPYGPYTIVEENRAGWNEITDREIDVDVTSGLCVEVDFTNEQDDNAFCIEGRKLDANGGYGVPGFTIETTQVGPDGEEVDGALDVDDVVTDGLGKFTINLPDNDYRVPGGLFQVCEDFDDQDNWLPHTPTCQIVRVPEWPMGQCVELKDFVNQQVGHSEREKQESMAKAKKDMDGGKDMAPKGGMSMGPMDKGMNCKNVHIVKKGERLFDIGKDYKVTPQAMLDANPDARKSPQYWVYEGQQVCIP